ncbi:toll/interleukin-1 receptor domain-containing protein [Streptomyces kanamyceticus]|uniref:Toll/interleukin-1 receptor domain-containing protein n=1 Tax=Streptomyces kanamyceticus TaxID=1967 RepID=A0A5J6GKT7_STRKN|nr:toll/interleukin-1 receptor domain-containing protein [Streptomyces kanamyceticus]QEU95703.1 toll/interleukin-1 receptor domain-containing protein [Streptomyces kanamyceticus]
MPDVFVNYRTGDGDQVATTLRNKLTDRFGEGRIFRASQSIRPGAFFDDELMRGVRRSGVLLAVIGPDWINHPALHRADDWVRKEILEALRCGIPVIPILAGRRTERPTRNQLPKRLARLADCQTLRYDNQNDTYDIQRIGDVLTDLIPDLAKTEEVRPESTPSGTTQNNVGTVHGGNVVQAGTVNGDSGAVIKGAQGPVHTGPGNLYSNSAHVTGENTISTVVSGDNHGGIRQDFGTVRRQGKDSEE